MRNIILLIALVATTLNAQQTSLFQVADQNNKKVLDVTSDGLIILSPNETADTYDDTLMVITNSQIKTFVDGNPGKGLARSYSVASSTTQKGTKSSLLQLTPDNYFIGHQSGSAITTGLRNNFLGYKSGMSTKSGNDNIFLGTESGLSNDFGYNNVYIGNKSGQNVFGGYDNVYIGQETGMTGHGQYNIFIGSKSGRANNGGSLNTFIGMESGTQNTTGQFNTFLGIQSGWKNTTGEYNLFLGSSSGALNTTGKQNVYLGNEAGSSQNGNNNVIVGSQAGQLSSGNSNVFLGYMAGRQELGSNKLVIYNNYGDSTQALIWGSFDVPKRLRFNSIYCGIGTNAVERLDVNGGVKIGMSYGTNLGTIRWTGTDLQVYKSSGWSTVSTAKSGENNSDQEQRIASLEKDNSVLKQENSDLKKEIEMIKVYLKIK